MNRLNTMQNIASHVLGNILSKILSNGVSEQKEQTKDKISNSLSLLHEFSKVKLRLVLMPDDMSLSIFSYLSFDELYTLYIAHSKDVKCIKKAFMLRTNHIPWVINVIVRNPIGKRDCKYVYSRDDVIGVFMDVGNYDIYFNKQPILSQTINKLNKNAKYKTQFEGETIWRTAECIRIIIIKGTGGKIASLSYIPDVLTIPLEITREKGIYRCSLKGDRYLINDISHQWTSAIDNIFFSENNLKPQKPCIIQNVVNGMNV